MDRRRFLSLSGKLAIGLSATALLPRRARGQAAADAANVELVTVTPTEAVLTFDSAAETEALVRWGPAAGALTHEAADPAGPTRFHRLTLTGLQPGTEVAYSIEVDGLPVDENPYSPGVFTTLAEPGGPLLFTFATITDLHVGLTSAGAVGGLGDFVPVQCPLQDADCWAVANQGVIAALNQAAPDFVIAKGDLSHEYRREEFEAARALLDQLQMPWYAVRGNHDRQGENPEDLFPGIFGLAQTHYAFEHMGVRFIVLDSSRLSDGFPEIGDAQWTWLEEELSAYDVHQPFFLILHHAVSEEASIIFSLFPEDQQRLFGLLERKKGLAGILSGHSHRNIVTRQAELGDTPCVETSTTVHYPGGYNLYRIYRDGYLQTYHKIDGALWRTWEEAGRDMYRGEAQQILLGDLADRNFAHAFSLPLPDPGSGGGGCGCAPSPDERGGDAETAAILTALAAARLAGQNK